MVARRAQDLHAGAILSHDTSAARQATCVPTLAINLTPDRRESTRPVERTAGAVFSTPAQACPAGRSTSKGRARPRPCSYPRTLDRTSHSGFRSRTALMRTMHVQPVPHGLPHAMRPPAHGATVVVVVSVVVGVIVRRGKMIHRAGSHWTDERSTYRTGISVGTSGSVPFRPLHRVAVEAVQGRSGRLRRGRRDVLLGGRHVSFAGRRITHVLTMTIEVSGVGGRGAGDPAPDSSPVTIRDGRRVREADSSDHGQGDEHRERHRVKAPPDGGRQVGARPGREHSGSVRIAVRTGKESAGVDGPATRDVRAVDGRLAVAPPRLCRRPPAAPRWRRRSRRRLARRNRSTARTRALAQIDARRERSRSRASVGAGDSAPRHPGGRAERRAARHPGGAAGCDGVSRPA